MATFPPKTPAESEVFAVDFTRILGPFVTILSGTVTATVLEGTDPTPSNIVSGPAAVGQNPVGTAGKVLLQRIATSVEGVRYKLLFRATCSDGTNPEVETDFWSISNFT